ncbi:hypothetical protein Desti_2364 [Desulfomonile tiedjei DSM 6799]|uniref:Uncharacterized protein n=1 Tax=Desulfomonile tiedjei (strain ATCC 49306 / DSM 6799 / DCB-1) TaxID=706587 RepID=I4C658_DESTA|nr:hypothetical protein Desti_2364 [Desulfomonile tiedjei DSM 6799]
MTVRVRYLTDATTLVSLLGLTRVWPFTPTREIWPCKIMRRRRSPFGCGRFHVLARGSRFIRIAKISVRLKIRNIGGCRASVPAHLQYDQ